MNEFIVTPARGGTYIRCPMDCGWKTSARAGSSAARFRRHWRARCRERVARRWKPPAHRVFYGRAIVPFAGDRIWRRGKMRRVENVQLPVSWKEEKVA